MLAAPQRWISLRHLLLEPGRTLLVLAGVVLGVGVFVSIRLANRSALGSFSETVDAVAGRANLQIQADAGSLDEQWLRRVRELPGVVAAAPVVQAAAAAAPGEVAWESGELARGETGPFRESLLILGIDPLAEGPFGRVAQEGASLPQAAALFLDPEALALTRTTAARMSVSVGDTVTLLVGGRPHPRTVALILDSPELQQAAGGAVAVTSLAAAQTLFHREGRLDRIDLLVRDADRDRLRAELQQRLPAGARAELPDSRSRQVESMVRAFGLNLTALAFIALFVASFLIFNAVSMSVVRRRQEIGILRSLGVTRPQVVGMFLGEAVLVGVVGSLGGLVLGTLLARFTLAAISTSITALYLQVYATRVILDPESYAAGLGLGIGMSALAALAPALEAARTPPAMTARQGMLIEAQELPTGRWALAGVGLLAAAGAIAAWTVTARRPEGGFVSAFLLLFGFTLLTPGFTLLGERCFGRPAAALGGIESRLGVRYLRDSVLRTSTVVAALLVSVGMLIGLSVMVDSFRKTVQVWVNQTLRGDLYVEPAGRSVNGSATALDPAFVQAALRLPGCAAVDTYRSEPVTVNGRLTRLIAIDFEVQAARGRFRFTQGDPSTVLRSARAASEVIVTESFAFHHRLRPGDAFELPGPRGPFTTRVAGVFYDYTSDAGAIMIDQALYRRLWRSDRTESLAIYLAPGATHEGVRADLLRLAAGGTILTITPNQALRSRVMHIFDQTFRITYALQAITVLVAVLGVVSTLTALVTQRGREIAMLRAAGAQKSQIRKMVLFESGLLGLLGSLLGCACGLCLALLLTYVINKQFFGWSIRFTLDPLLFVQSVALMVVSALLAGLVPARLAAGRSPAHAMRVE